MRNFMSNTRFMLLWSLGSVAALFTSAIAGSLVFIVGGLAISSILGDQLTHLPSLLVLVIGVVWFGSIGMTIGLIFGWVQKAILKIHTREPWRGWMISSSIGGVMGIIAIVVVLALQGMGYFIMQVVPPTETLLWFAFQIFIIFFGSLGICQTFALQQYIRGAWVWILANMVAAVVLYSLLAFGTFSWATTPLLSILVGFLITAAPGIVTGFALVWLMNSNWRQDY